MNSERLIVVSADCHAGPDKMSDFRSYVEPAFRDDYDDYVARIDAYEAQLEQRGPSGRGGAPSREGDEGLWDADARERYLDADGISAELIFIQGATPFGRYPSATPNKRLDYQATAAQSGAGCRAYNRWLADLCSKDTTRHIGITQIPIPDVDAAVKEVEFASKIGLRGGVQLPPMGENMPYYSLPAYEPLWAACEMHDMPLHMHGASPVSFQGSLGVRLALTLTETDWWGHRGLAHLIFTGVFERYPKLRLAITEQRTHWVAPLLRELDSVYEWGGNPGIRQELPRRPSEYFKSNCFIGASFMSRLECDARADVGFDRLMWGSDYPHQEGTWPYTNAALRNTFGGDVPSNELRAMLGENAARCYHFDLEALQAVADRIGLTEADVRNPIKTLPTHDPSGPYIPSWAFRQAGPWH